MIHCLLLYYVKADKHSDVLRSSFKDQARLDGNEEDYPINSRTGVSSHHSKNYPPLSSQPPSNARSLHNNGSGGDHHYHSKYRKGGGGGGGGVGMHPPDSSINADHRSEEAVGSPFVVYDANDDLSEPEDFDNRDNSNSDTRTDLESIMRKESRFLTMDGEEYKFFFFFLERILKLKIILLTVVPGFHLVRFFFFKKLFIIQLFTKKDMMQNLKYFGCARLSKRFFTSKSLSRHFPPHLYQPPFLSPVSLPRVFGDVEKSEQIKQFLKAARKEEPATGGSGSKKQAGEVMVEDWNKARDMINNGQLYLIEEFIRHLSESQQKFGMGTENIEAESKVFREQIMSRLQYMLQECIIGGKNIRGITLLQTIDEMKKLQNKKLTHCDIQNSIVCACAVEALQAYFLVMDDIMDQSLTRRGKPCWYKYDNVGLKAANDGPIIQSYVFWLLYNQIFVSDEEEKLVGKKSSLSSMLASLFHHVTLCTALGQMMDLELIEDMNKLKDYYTLDRYQTIVKYKTSLYSFYLPFTSALYLNGLSDFTYFKNQTTLDNKSDTNHNETNKKENLEATLFEFVYDMSIKLGYKFQIDDDAIDCFGDEKLTGKQGTDIQDKKCSWLIVKALPLCNSRQFNLLKANYGINDPSKIAAVKDIYRELRLHDLYKEEESKLNHEILHTIQSIDQHPYLKQHLPKQIKDISCKKKLVEKINKHKKKDRQKSLLCYYYFF
ncbi:hypothetical protein RFI_24518 [Reticulomyxa filosa]|uniref:Farnesyl pyrophosphate synthase n=1 Tax=Reticulomyxa filosa TaxID=46433 RepID=X6MHG1_RETFI|nr:hypothetical protein RFI_24518 [Reticulomyxa filosa]|eukprot:ETO12857.1 hypothetical protein RFI_24518 [Reticulomyxa filosa]